jgi:hypothetical protein
MKKLKSVTLLSCISASCLLLPCFAQETDSSGHSGKHEIGVSIGSLIVGALGNSPNPQTIGITYKRIYGNWAGKANLSYEAGKTNPYPENYQTTYGDTLLLSRFETNSFGMLAGRLGIEYRLPLRWKCIFVAGADLRMARKNQQRRIKENIHKIDSIARPGTAQQLYYLTRPDEKDLLRENQRQLHAGIGLSAGLLIPAGKRWWISAHLKLDSYLSSVKSTSKDLVAGTEETYRKNFLNFSAGPLLSDVSVFFRF